MRKNKLIILIVSFFVIFLGIWLWQGIYFTKTENSQIKKIFLIEKGQGIEKISFNLQKENLIKNKWSFLVYVFLKGDSKKLQAGEYLLSLSQTIPEITEKFVFGDVVKEKIIIIEGWNLRDIGWYFENKGICQAEELYDQAEELYGLENLEGYLFPDTYEIRKSDTFKEIVKKMLDNFNEKLTSELREEIKNQGKTISEIITMASLLEKEVRTSTDKKIVSGILWKRMSHNIPLQVDATIVYITGKQTIKISKEDLKIDSPYNTYKFRGLPIAPISNPGLESIKAAIYPEDSGYFYYLSTPEGKTIFSKTLKEHNFAKQKYLK